VKFKLGLVKIECTHNISTQSSCIRKTR